MDVGGLIERVSGDLDALLSAGFDPVDAGEAADLVSRLEAAGRRMDAARVALVDVIDRKGLYRCDGHGSARVMVRHVAGLSGAEATRRAQSAVALRDLPAVAAEHRRGELGTCQVRRLARTHSNRRVRSSMAAAEAHFLDWARQESFKGFDEMVSGWERLADEDGAAQSEQRANDQRDARLVQDFDGSWELSARCGSVTGARLRDNFEHLVAAEFAADWAEARGRLGDVAAPRRPSAGSDLAAPVLPAPRRRRRRTSDVDVLRRGVMSRAAAGRAGRGWRPGPRAGAPGRSRLPATRASARGAPGR